MNNTAIDKFRIFLYDSTVSGKAPLSVIKYLENKNNKITRAIVKL